MMIGQSRETIERHIHTHSEQSDADYSAVTTLRMFLRANGKINVKFAEGDKWPNSDGLFELVLDPAVSRRPGQNFFVQIKGTQHYTETQNAVKYPLKNLAFPAFVACQKTLDPCILFVVLDPGTRGLERVFWKYMSVDFVNSIDYEKKSVTISFTTDEEIKNTDESVNCFCNQLAEIVDRHSFISHLNNVEYSRQDVERIIRACDEEITESIARMSTLKDTRDEVSRRILTRLDDLCLAVLILNILGDSSQRVSIRLAWERALLSAETQYLSTFYRGLQYIGRRIPDSGQSERLMLKYYNFLWQIKRFLSKRFGMPVLFNLEQFPPLMDNVDREYYELVAASVNAVTSGPDKLCPSRFYVQKSTPFFVGAERYYEVTLQLAGLYATKYNRITAYTKMNIVTDYSVQISYTDASITLWGIDSTIKVITGWRVSIAPACINKLGKLVCIPTKISSTYGEYISLMNFLTETGINLLDLIDLRELSFFTIIDNIYKTTNTSKFKEVLLTLRNDYSGKFQVFGKNVVRYVLLGMREETLENVLPNRYNLKRMNCKAYLSRKCLPFEKNPFISNLAGSKTSEGRLRDILRAAGTGRLEVVRPYLALKEAIKQTGEIYFQADTIASQEEFARFNSQLDDWERSAGHSIRCQDGLAYIQNYEDTTIYILKKLLALSKSGNRGQRELNQGYLKQNESALVSVDNLKIKALREIFVDSHLLLIYGAAGTGKTTLINYISNLMMDRSKLFLTKTHTALQNLKRRISNPGPSADFVSIDSFARKVSLQDYDVIFVDECSTIDNRIMKEFLKKLAPNTFVVLAGDIYQIESIEFGNWFFYAKDIIKTSGANIELLSTWRTKDESLIQLWDEVRQRGVLITEMLVIDGPFSENIGPSVLERTEEDEVVLCLNYDGKFGLNNMNNYFQNANKSGPVIDWQEWSYKKGDPVLFNETGRFPSLYNNLKGRIVEIQKTEDKITFTIDVEAIITENDCEKEGLDFISIVGDSSTRIRFEVYAYEDGSPKGEDEDEDEEYLRMMSVIPFQLAYAVSIHKAQGLEYDSVKVIIPSSNSERITHGIFYTAITRAKKKLKLYWSSETMEEVVKGFASPEVDHLSLGVVKSKLQLGGPDL